MEVIFDHPSGATVEQLDYFELPYDTVLDMALDGDAGAVSYINAHPLQKYSPDQPRDWHGRFGEGGGGAVTQELGTATLPKGWQTEPTNRGLAYGGGKYAATYHITGSTITLNVTEKAAEKLSIEKQHAVMEVLSKLDESDHIGHSVRVDLVMPKEMGRGSSTAGGITITNDTTGSSVIRINAGALNGPVLGDNVGKAAGADVVDYTVTHEWGHALEAAKDVDRESDGHNDLGRRLDRIKVIKESERPSAYGDIKRTNEYEAYAEAFADWRLSAEPGELATKLAKSEGWGAR